MNHQDARNAVTVAFRQVFMREPTRSEAQLVQAVGFLESRYGRAWQGAGVGSNNWGAIQYGRTPCDPAVSFEYTDTSPQPDGTSRPYRICFKRYAGPADGAADLVKTVYKRRPSVLAAATAGDAYAFSAAMYDTRYYEGFGPTREARIANHHRAMVKILGVIALALGETLPDGGQPPPPTLRRGSSGEAVREWQRIVGVVSDGQFGPVTEAATKAWQTARGLKADGIVGPVTWGAAEKEPEPCNLS